MHEESIITILKALADRTRLDIVRNLIVTKGIASCSNVSQCSQLSQPAMSHHLNKLVEARVITEKRQGKEKIYELNTDLLTDYGIDITKL